MAWTGSYLWLLKKYGKEVSWRSRPRTSGNEEEDLILLLSHSQMGNIHSSLNGRMRAPLLSVFFPFYISGVACQVRNFLGI